MNRLISVFAILRADLLPVLSLCLLAAPPILAAPAAPAGAPAASSTPTPTTAHPGVSLHPGVSPHSGVSPHVGVSPHPGVAPQEPVVSFYSQVKPILQRHCQGCHQPVSAGGKLILTSYAAFKQGGSGGPAFKRGKPAESLVLNYIIGDPPAMPKNQPPLDPGDVKLIRQWISQGAADDTPIIKDTIDQEHPPVYRTAPVISALAYSPDGSTLAVSGYREVLLHKADGSGLLARLVGQAHSIESLTYSPDGTILAAVGGNPAGGGEVQLWDTAHQKLTQSIPTTNDTVFGASFSPDGKKLAVGGADNSVRVFSMPDGKQLIKFDNHSDWVFGTAFTMDNQHLVSASRDQAIKLILLEGETGSFVDDINTHHSALRCLARLPKEDKVLCAGDDGIVRLYQVFRTTARTMNMEDHNLLREYPAVPSTISAMSVSPDGSRVAVADLAGDIRVFDVSNAHILASLKLYSGGIFALAFHPDSKQFAAGGFDGKVRLFSTTGQLLKMFVPVPLASQEASRTVSSHDKPRPDNIKTPKITAAASAKSLLKASN